MEGGGVTMHRRSILRKPWYSLHMPFLRSLVPSLLRSSLPNQPAATLYSSHQRIRHHPRGSITEALNPATSFTFVLEGLGENLIVC